MKHRQADSNLACLQIVGEAKLWHSHLEGKGGDRVFWQDDQNTGAEWKKHSNLPLPWRETDTLGNGTCPCSDVPFYKAFSIKPCLSFFVEVLAIPFTWLKNTCPSTIGPGEEHENLPSPGAWSWWPRVSNSPSRARGTAHCWPEGQIPFDRWSRTSCDLGLQRYSSPPPRDQAAMGHSCPALHRAGEHSWGWQKQKHLRLKRNKHAAATTAAPSRKCL